MMKTAILSILSCCIITFLISTLAVSEELDLEKIINGINRYDSMIKSGEYDVIYKVFQWTNIEYGIAKTDRIIKCHLAFDGRKNKDRYTRTA